MSGVAVRLENVYKGYEKGGSTIRVLSDCSLELAAGEAVSIVGPSGCGKSTFLHLLGMLDRPGAGRIFFDGTDIASMRESSRDRLRNRNVGFVFQAHHLLPEHSAVDNVAIPARLAGCSVAVAGGRAEALLAAMGLGKRMTHRPGELSGGEQQRVAIARAMVMGPGLVLADEPTGNLDPATSDGVFNGMMDMVNQLGSTLVVVTHSLELAGRFGRRLRLSDGHFEEVSA
ncbi:MAG: lipoprotein-releasing system ATP-binding protein [Myxococcota bacterium]|jgi:lipoprotein-releasing system ATP-binding protein